MDDGRRDFLKVAASALLGAAAGAGALRAAQEYLGAEPWPGGRSASRWALAIDIYKCSAPDLQAACIEACRRVHNCPRLADDRHHICWIRSASFERVFPEQVFALPGGERNSRSLLLLCNHCQRPPCVAACPTGASFRRPDGIVLVDQHRCIGCRQCLAACPYGARSFNWIDPSPHVSGEESIYPRRRAGVAEKCNLCVERLARGLEPACVEVANSLAGKGAIFLGDLTDATSPLVRALRVRPSLRRRPQLGLEPHVFYLL